MLQMLSSESRGPSFAVSKNVQKNMFISQLLQLVGVTVTQGQPFSYMK